MKAADIMTTRVVTAGPDDEVRTLARLMSEHGISGIPIVGPEGQVLGMVSEGDLLRRREAGTERRRGWLFNTFAAPQTLAAEFTKSHGRKASDVMSRPVVTIDEHVPIARIVDLLERRGIKRVPVVRNGRLVGIVSRANLVRALAAMPEAQAEDDSPDDGAIRTALRKQLERLGFADATDLEVVVADGAIHLWGSYGSENERTVIRVAAESLAGVRSVADHRAPRSAVP